MSGVDYYELLELKPGASAADIKSAHRALVKVLHPDAGGNQIMFRLVQEAYETLIDPARRANYDRRRAFAGVRNDSSVRQRTAQEWQGEPHEEWFVREHNNNYQWQPESEPEPEPTWIPPIPLQQISWWEQVNPAAKVSWRPGFGWAQRWFFLFAAVWSALLVATVVPMLTTDFSVRTVLVVLMVVVPVSYLVVTTAGWAVPKLLAVLTYIWAIGMVGLGIYSIVQGEVSGIGVLVLAIGVFGLPPLGRKYLTSRITERIFTPEFRTFNLFGASETQLLDDDGDAVDDDSGDKLTLDLVSGYLGHIPAARIFHGLAWPGSAKAVVDHAVLCGHKLILIDSKKWQPGHYSCDEKGNLLRNGRKFDENQLRLARTVAAYQLLMPRMDVHGVVLIHTTQPGKVTSTMPPDTTVSVMGVEEFVLRIGAGLAQEPAMVDREVFLTLLDQVRA